MVLVKYMNELKEWAQQEIGASLSRKARFLIGGKGVV